MIRTFAPLLLALLFAPGLPAQSAGRLDALVKEIGSDRYGVRDRASADLESLGAAALPALRAAIRTADLETVRRASELIRRIEEKQQVEQMFAPKRVHLKLADVTGVEAVAELSRQSGYAIRLEAPADTVRRLTLDTGATTFWQAFDQLCDHAGWQEKRPAAPLPNGAPHPGFPPLNGVVMPQVVNPTAKTMTGDIVLVPGTTPARRVSYAGAVRFVLHAAPAVVPKLAEHRFTLEMAVEPRLQPNLPTLVGAPGIECARDDQRQALGLFFEASAATVPLAMSNQLINRRYLTRPTTPMPQVQTPIRLRPGTQPAQRLRELSGTMAVGVTLVNETLAALDDVTQAAGKAAEGKNGGRMQLQSIERTDAGNYRLRVALDNLTPTGNARGAFGVNNVIIQGQGNIVFNGGITLNAGGVLPDLLDAHGQKYTVGTIMSQSLNITNGSVARTVQVEYRPTSGVGVPSRLVLYGTRPVTLPVAFRFQDVPLE